MASRNTHGSRTTGQPQPSATNRQNEYFVPRDGIDREVITADICRYLGNDALVRPGTYENPQTGALVQGYFITAYRNLTTAMIEDLKADSARWDQERRAHARTAQGGAQYRYSETHSARQQQGPTADNPAFPDYPRDYDQQPRYPGTGTQGYTGVASSFGQAAGGPYGAQGGGYTQPYGGVTPQYPAAQDPRGYPASGSMMQGGYSQNEVAYASGANRPIADPRFGNDPYAQQQAAAARDRIPATMQAQQAGIYSTAAQGQQAYPQTPQAQSGYYQQVQVPTTGNPTYAQAQPPDPFYGRGAYQDNTTSLPTSEAPPSDYLASPAGTSAQGFTSGQGQAQGYDETAGTRTAAPTSSSQMATSGVSSGARRSDRESDRHDRHGSADRPANRHRQHRS